MQPDGDAQDVPFRTTMAEPLGKMNAYFPVINEHIAKRNKKVESCASRFLGPSNIPFSCSITTQHEAN